MENSLGNRVILLADDEDSWPWELRELLAARFEALAAYNQELLSIDRQAETDVMLRISRPANSHQDIWDDTVQSAQAMVSDYNIAGYHCTRLTSSEQQRILKGGMLPLSSQLVAERVAAAEAESLLSSVLAKRIIASNQATSFGRRGLLYFIFSRDNVSDKAGVERLFRSWGGEAVYGEHEGTAEGDALRKIGTPCIVMAAVPARSIRTFRNVGQRFINHFLAARGVPLPDRPEWEGSVEEPITDIIRIASLGDPAFAELTNCANWVASIR